MPGLLLMMGVALATMNVLIEDIHCSRYQCCYSLQGMGRLHDDDDNKL